MTPPAGGPGAFVAVTGASGVGKDAVLAAARERCGDDVHFPRRVITRLPGSGEESTPLREEEFHRAREEGAFAVSWQAHGLSYAIPTSADDAVGEGRVVVANVSRGALAALAERYARLVVVRVTVSDAVRAQRLRTRGRETGDDVARRLSRHDPAPERAADHEIRNDGSIAEGAAQLVRIIGAARRATVVPAAPSTSPSGTGR